MDTLKRLHAHISALADGELPDGELELAMAALGTPDGRAAWLAYHLIGDALRAGDAPVPGPDFSRRLAARLAAEPALGVPAGSAGGQAAEAAAPPAQAAATLF